MPAKAGIRLLKKCQTPAFAGVTALVLLYTCLPAAAEEYAYAPEGCEFRMELPGEPSLSRKCSPDNPEICRDMTGYTKVFGMDATINVSVTCNPAPPQMYDQYNGDVMQATMEAMMGKDQMADYETGYQEFDVAKEAVLLGIGKTGNSDRVFVAQLWIGRKSVFTVEAELIGQKTEESDKMFADILHSIRHESWPKGGEAPKEKNSPDAAPQDKKQ